ncbi:hypothetical protein E4T56_gene1216 [Termitomyces sp. T112]|nr:hypothetical protein E4T56_gene1216 [Termitomyces sp. T112]
MASYLAARKQRRSHCVKSLIIILLFIPAISGVNFDQCLEDIRSGHWGEFGGRNNAGHPVAISNATAITYELCLRACGSGPEPFQWSVFSQQFSSWLLPWLALVSQLPFGSEDKVDNLISMLLTVGSPALAAYSLALTVLNGRWIARRFSSYKFPNTLQAVRILSSLQQSPLQINTHRSLLASLIVLPQNDEWWRELVVWLDYTHAWSISAVTSIAWVIIAYLFTVIDSLTGDVTNAVNANGEGVGSLWIWLLPIVIGWLQISPKCDTKRLFQAMRRANDIAYVATPPGTVVLATSISQEQAISLREGVNDPLYNDERCTVPIYNYARFLPWVRAVEEVSEMFRAASHHAHLHLSVDPSVEWERKEKSATGIDPKNRIGKCVQVQAYCLPLGEQALPTRRSMWGPNVFSRIAIASLIALSLQWGTTGAAVVVVWFTPTTGLGCRSGAYLLYGIVSTVVWMLLLVSSFLSHYVSMRRHPADHLSTILARLISIGIRRLGKVLAVFNAIWIVVTCLFQFSNYLDRCYCNSSVLGRGITAWNVITYDPQDISNMRGAWIGGVVLAAGSATLFVFFVNLFINPRLPN